MFAFATLATLITAASAASIASRANNGDTDDCFTRYAGTLTARNSTGFYKAFTASTSGTKLQTAYTGRGESPLVVQFQACNSLGDELRSANETEAELYGRLYVPAEKKCISITNQANTAGPYYTTMKTCSTAFAQRFRLDQTDRPGAVEWFGNTNPSTGAQQGGCGLLGFKATNTTGIPYITHTNQQITLECTNDKPFFIVQQVL